MGQIKAYTTKLRALFRFGIRQKVLLILLTTLLITLTLNTWVALRAQKEEILKETNRRGQEATHFIAQNLAYSVISYDYHTIELLLRDLTRQEDIAYAKVISAQGNVMAETGAVGNKDPHLVMFSEDIIVNKEVVGKLFLGLSTERIVKSLDKQTLASIQRQIFVILAITLAELLGLSYIIVRPITTISAVISKNVSGDGIVAQAIPISSRDEFGEMAYQFNLLRNQLNLAQAKLQSKVEIANQELQSANTCLIAQAEELRRINAELKDMTITDSLTGLYNRRQFQTLMQNEVERAVRKNEISSIIFIDIDNFKTYNDVYGHDFGDEIIQNVARILKSRMRSSDIACRFGGDEFFILCRGATIANSLNIAEELRQKVAEQPLYIRGTVVSVTFSIGIATIPSTEPITTAHEFFRCADSALYHSKQMGRNRISHYAMIDKHKRTGFI